MLSVLYAWSDETKKLLRRPNIPEHLYPLTEV